MSILELRNREIKGLSICLPTHQDDNLEYELLSEKERHKLVKTTGIRFKRFASENTTASDMSFCAARRLIEKLNWNIDEIDVLINITQTPDYLIPGTAHILHDRLGLRQSSIAFDINLGCSGYVYGLYIASSLLDGKVNKKALLLTGDKSSHPVNYLDKSAFPLFGDGCAATAIEYDESAGEMLFDMRSDGSGKDAIIVRGGALRNPLMKPEDLQLHEISDGISRKINELELNGLDIFNFATTKVPPQIIEVLSAAKSSVDQVDYFVFHQANKLMNELIRKKLKISPEQTPYSLQDYGNTSSASIPITIATQLKNKLRGDESMVFSGFGVGLSWATVWVSRVSFAVIEIIEME